MRRALIAVLTLLIGLSSFSSALAFEASPDVIKWAIPQIDGYYRTLFALQGQEYHPPRVTIIDPARGEKASTGCGIATGEGNAFYCPVDQQIVLGQDILDWVAKTDEFGPAYVLAHEWAHHAQTLSGTDSTYVPTDGDWNEVYTLENELRADCMAGSWMANVDSRGFLDATDLPNMLVIANDIGDSNPYRTQSHGFGAERLRALFTGYEHGIVACGAITPLPRGHAA